MFETTPSIIAGIVGIFPIYALLFSMNRKLGSTVANTQANSKAINRLQNTVYDH